MLIDTPSFRRFAGIDMIVGRIADETTIHNFRHLLEEHQIAEQVLESVNQSLSEKGMMLKEGTILDATIINPPSSTKNKKGERDPEMHSVAKGKQWFSGSTAAQKASPMGCAAITATRKPRATVLMQARVWSIPW
jgi:transposase, IS5 family